MNLIKLNVEATTKKASHTEMPEDFMYNDFPCILTARDVPWDKKEATTPNLSLNNIVRAKLLFSRNFKKIKNWFY